jgi:hypothetical protein
LAIAFRAVCRAAETSARSGIPEASARDGKSTAPEARNSAVFSEGMMSSE